MQGTKYAVIRTCPACHALSVSLIGPDAPQTIVPGTDDRRSECYVSGLHRPFESIGRAQVGRMAHWALYTVINRESGDRPASIAIRDAAHVATAWLAVGNPGRRTGAPSVLFEHYGMSTQGLACARIAVKLYAATVDASEAYRWHGIASLIRGSRGRNG